MITVKQLKEMLDQYPDDLRVVTSSEYDSSFKDAGEPVKRLIKKDEEGYHLLYPSQEDQADEEAVVLW